MSVGIVSQGKNGSYFLSPSLLGPPISVRYSHRSNEILCYHISGITRWAIGSFQLRLLCISIRISIDTNIKKRKNRECQKDLSGGEQNDGLKVNQYWSIVKVKRKPTQRLKVVRKKYRRSG